MSQQFTDEEAKIFLERIMPNKDYLYIFVPFGLADVFFAAGLSHAVQEKKNKKATVLIVSETMRNFDFHYENVVKFSYLSYKLMPAIVKYTYDNGDYESDNYVYGSFRSNGNDEFIFDAQLSTIDRWRKNVFDLPLDTPLKTPIVNPLSEEHIEYLNQNYILDKERTIIIAALPTRDKLDELNFFNDLIRYLKGQGYVVYSYIENFFEKPLPNTKPMTTSFDELSYIARNVKCVIGSRLGSLSLFATTPVKIFALNDFPAWFQDISMFYPQSNCEVFYTTMAFLKVIETENAKAGVILYDVELSHPKIKQDHVFDSYEGVLKGIVKKL